MSNFLAIATVTATLSHLLKLYVNEVFPSTAIKMLRPDKLQKLPADEKGINIYLYQIIPSATCLNLNLPTRESSGKLLQRPRVALTLNYLLSFYGNNAALEPERLLGSAACVLNAKPMLTRKMIRDTISTQCFAYLAKSNLADDIELVKFTPLSLSTEEISKLWSMFPDTPYVLSVAYQGNVVFIEGEETPQEALPVREPKLYAVPFSQPVIERIAAEGEADQPIVAGSKMVLYGKHLCGDVTLLKLGGVEVQPRPGDVEDMRIGLQLSSPDPVPSLRAGVQGVQVVHKMMMGVPPAPHLGFSSDVEAFVLRPTIKDPVSVQNVQGNGDALRSADVAVKVEPKIAKGQGVTLLLNEISSDGSKVPEAYSFATNVDADVDVVTFHIANVKAAEYLIRVQVDGAESPLEVDRMGGSPTQNRYIGPKVKVP